YQEIERLFDHLQAIYRPMMVTLVRSPLGRLVADHTPKWRSWLQSHGRTMRLDPPRQDPPGDFDPLQLGMGLAALIAWRAETEEAGRQPRLSWRIDEGFFEVCWDEARRSSPLRRRDRQSRRSTRSTASGQVIPLAIPLLARIVTAHGGCLESAHEPSTGFCMRLRWPQFCEPVLRT